MRPMRLDFVKLTYLATIAAIASLIALPNVLAQQPIATWTTTPSFHHLMSEVQQAICKFYNALPMFALLIVLVGGGMYALVRILCFVLRVEVSEDIVVMDISAILVLALFTAIMIVILPMALKLLAKFAGFNINWSVCSASS